MELTPDTLLHDRYRIIRLLGQGGMGAVYLAHDQSLEHEVAVKYNRNPSSEGSSQFLREARLLAALHHPNLPRVTDYFLSGQDQYLVMDYVPGRDLQEVLDEEGAQPLPRVMQWAQQIGSALNYMHSQKPPVIHRDIKPANIKLMSDGSVVLVDFGIAKAADPTQATATGARGYTPGYAPPEQYGTSPTGPYSDQFSLAATLYALLTGQKPADAVQRAIGSAALVPLDNLNPSVPVHVSRAIGKALSIRPEDRFASAGDFLAALTDPNRTVLVPPPPVVPPLAHSPTQPAPPRKGRALLWVLAGLAAIVVLAGAAVGGYLLLSDGLKPVPAATTQALTPPPAVSPLASTPTLQQANATPTSTPTFTPQPSATPTPQALGNGRLIVFSSDRADGTTLQLWTMRAALQNDGSIVAYDLSQLTFSPGDKRMASWSPDGTKLLYSAPGATTENGLDVYLIDLANPASPPVNLTSLRGDEIYPAWSADGKLIAFSNQGRYNDLTMLYMMNADGSNLVRLSLDYQETMPEWYPDMSYLLFVVMANDHQYFYQRPPGEVYSTRTPYDKTTHFGRLGMVADPAIAADGQNIAFTQLDGAQKHIFSVETKSLGGNATRLTNNSTDDYDPDWSPDAQWLVFTSGRDGNPEIYIMTTVGLFQTNLTNSPGRDLDPAWQP